MSSRSARSPAPTGTLLGIKQPNAAVGISQDVFGVQCPVGDPRLVERADRPPRALEVLVCQRSAQLRERHALNPRIRQRGSIWPNGCHCFKARHGAPAACSV